MSSAERALHQRAGLACGAATEASVPGRFRAWSQAGLLAVRATEPSLSFLSTVSGVTRERLPDVIEFVHAPVWNGVTPTVVVTAEVDAVAEKALHGKGFVRVGERGLAIRRLAEPDAPVAGVSEGGDFLPVLRAGYEVSGAVAALIEAEHGLPEMRGFLAVEGKRPIGAAAMTIHDNVAVLGGASTLRAHRGKGAQSRLLRHRLRLAAEARCALAVATVVPGSVSAANLVRAGFTVHLRTAWGNAP